MNTSLFRQKSIDRISSPEELSDYVKVASPSVWMILAAVIVLLLGACIWGFFGQLHTTLPAAAVCEGGTLTCYIPEEEIAKVVPGQTVAVGGAACSIGAIGERPIQAGALDAYALHVGALRPDQWVYEASASCSLSDGVYAASILVESVSPMSFVLN